MFISFLSFSLPLLSTFLCPLPIQLVLSHYVLPPPLVLTLSSLNFPTLTTDFSPKLSYAVLNLPHLPLYLASCPTFASYSRPSFYSFNIDLSILPLHITSSDFYPCSPCSSFYPFPFCLCPFRIISSLSPTFFPPLLFTFAVNLPYPFALFTLFPTFLRPLFYTFITLLAVSHPRLPPHLPFSFKSFRLFCSNFTTIQSLSPLHLHAIFPFCFQ